MIQFRRASGCESNTCVEVGFKRATGCESGSCVEVGFRKSTASGDANGCVEVNCQHEYDQILVRDSKDQTGPVLVFNREEWSAFLRGASAGEFDVKS